MPQVGFEPTISVFEPTKRVHALDRADTVIGTRNTSNKELEVYSFNSSIRTTIE
jgi:hypothetical protein